jgi:outer membrane protein assembly factor BamB
MMRGVLGLLLMGTATTAASADWPQWRGPTRDGVAAEARLPRDWPGEPPAPVWRTWVGQGYSSPAVADGRLFILGRDREAREIAYCLDAATGKPLWTYPYPAPYVPPDPCTHGPNGTPTVDGDRVYFLGLGGRFHCFEVGSGRIRWQHDFIADYRGVKKDEQGDDLWAPPCGDSASPLVDGNRVIVPVGGPKAGAVAAFDRDRGTLVWKALDDRASYASPMRVTLAGVPQIAAFTGTRLVGLRIDDGGLLWDYPFNFSYHQTVLTPLVWNDLVITGGDNKPTVALRIDRRDSKQTATLAWRNDDLRGYLTTPILLGDHCLGYNRRAQLVCVELATGQTRWVQGTFGKYLVSIVRAGDQLLVLDDDGELHVLAADPAKFQRKVRWKLSEAGETWSHLAVVGSRLYVKDKEHVLCFDVGTP